MKAAGTGSWQRGCELVPLTPLSATLPAQRRRHLEQVVRCAHILSSHFLQSLRDSPGSSDSVYALRDVSKVQGFPGGAAPDGRAGLALLFVA